MNSPDTTTQVPQLLSGIRDLYGALCVMTRRILDEFSLSALQDLLRERSAVLMKINLEQTRLLGIADPRNWTRYGEYGEIRNSISAIARYDREITSRIVQDMNSISGELSSLAVSSSAAIKYARHSRG